MSIEIKGILSDNDIEGQAQLLWKTIESSGWLDTLEIQLFTFRQLNLSEDSTDKEIWHFAQENGLLILTNNRNMDGPDSLEQTLRYENTLESLPILTVGSKDELRLFHKINYPQARGVRHSLVPDFSCTTRTRECSLHVSLGNLFCGLALNTVNIVMPVWKAL